MTRADACRFLKQSAEILIVRKSFFGGDVFDLRRFLQQALTDAAEALFGEVIAEARAEGFFEKRREIGRV